MWSKDVLKIYLLSIGLLASANIWIKLVGIFYFFKISHHINFPGKWRGWEICSQWSSWRLTSWGHPHVSHILQSYPLCWRTTPPGYSKRDTETQCCWKWIQRDINVGKKLLAIFSVKNWLILGTRAQIIFMKCHLEWKIYEFELKGIGHPFKQFSIVVNNVPNLKIPMLVQMLETVAWLRGLPNGSWSTTT